ncbi:hypothetical protein KW797_04360 [Candidatus Parcubacteria bacterium]|nr:hypothetical protein [Candidatus Parcubacteria bacterium]
MNNIPLTLRATLAEDPFYRTCARQVALHDHVCAPDPLRPRKLIEWEHALYYAGKQLQARFAIVPLCWYVHRGPGAVKVINEWIALNRASDKELHSLSKAVDQFRRRAYLNSIYGDYSGEEVVTIGGDPVHNQTPWR